MAEINLPEYSTESMDDFLPLEEVDMETKEGVEIGD